MKSNGVKKPHSKTKAKKKPNLQKTVSFYKPVYKPECKAFDVTTTLSITNNTGGGNSISLNSGIISTPAGVAPSPGQRIGRRIRMKSVALHITFFPQISAASLINSDAVLFVLVVDREGGGNAPGLGDLYALGQTYGATSNGVLAHRNLNTSKRYKVLFKKVIPIQQYQPVAAQSQAASAVLLGQEASDNGHWEWFKDFGPEGMEVSYNNSTGTTGAAGDIETNQLWMCAWSQAGGQPVGVFNTSWQSRIRFFDA